MVAFGSAKLFCIFVLRLNVSHDGLAADMGMSEDIIEGLMDLSLLTKGEGGDAPQTFAKE